MPPDGVIPGGPSFVGTPAAPVEPVGAPASADGFLSVPGGPDFAGQPQPPDVPCDPTGEDWRGPPGPDGAPGPPGPQGPPGGTTGGGSGTVTSVATGAGLSGGPITTAGTIVADWHAGVVAALGGNLTLAAGTLDVTGTDVTDALGFTPYSNTNPAGYQTAANITASLAPYALIASSVASFNTRTGPVTLTSGDVTTALTFTPYNATNPSGYQTAANVTATLSSYALTSALPAASSSTPLVESGAGAVGTGTTFARADHVHPAAAGGGGIAEAPVGGLIYGRQGSTTSWLATLPLTGGTIDGALTVQKTVALSGNSDLYFAVGDATTARNQPLTYSYTAGSASGAISYLGWNVYANSSGTITRANTAKGGWFFQLDNRDAGVNADLLLRNVTNAGVVADRHTFGATGNFTITNNMQVGGVYRTSGGVQVMQARIGGWGATAPVNGVRVNSFDATTASALQVAQALAALLVDLRTHGMIGT